MIKDDKKTQKPIFYICEKCNFKTGNKKDFTRHINTTKHIGEDGRGKKPTQKNPKIYYCDCGKVYKYNQGLWNHRKKCNLIQPTYQQFIQSCETTCDNNEIKILTNLVLDVIKQNQELTNKIIDICNNNHNNNHNTVSNSNINSHNKTFNLHFFLNETCKNAMNISDFVNSLQLQLSDLENVGKLGYVDGISSIIVKNLNALDETTRPIHCTDKKRETFYITPFNISNADFLGIKNN